MALICHFEDFPGEDCCAVLNFQGEQFVVHINNQLPQDMVYFSNGPLNLMNIGLAEEMDER